MFQAKKGFTLVELMVVIVIIGVLAALAIPKFTDASTKAKVSEIPTVVAGWDHAVLARIAEMGAIPTAAADIVFTVPTSKWFAYTSAYTANATAVMTAQVAPNISVGGLTAASGSATSSIDTGGNIDHASGPFTKYMPNFDE